MEPPKSTKQPGKPQEQLDSQSLIRVGTLNGNSNYRQSNQVTGQSPQKISQQSDQSPNQSIQQEDKGDMKGRPEGQRSLQTDHESTQVGLQGSQVQGGKTPPSSQVFSQNTQTPVTDTPFSSPVPRQSTAPSESPADVQNTQPGKPSPVPQNLCLKFVKATQSDGKAGIAVVLQKSDLNQQGSQQEQAQEAQLQRRTLKQSSSLQSGTRLQKAPHCMSATQLPVSVQSQTAIRKSVPLPSDETAQAVNALIASTSEATQNTIHEHQRCGRKLTNSKSPVTKTPYQRQTPKYAPVPTSEPLPESSPSKSASAEQLFQALTNLLSQQKSQSQMSVNHQESLTPTGLYHHHHEIPKPHQLPQDNERLSFSHKQESMSKKKRRGRESEWGAMIKNINVIMFAIYRCKLCPDYYSTMKSTMSQHMKIIHQWTYTEAEEDTDTPVEGNVTITENIQNKVKDIQNIFERRFRNESIANDSLDLEPERQNELVEIPFSSMNACKIPVDETTVVKEHSNEEGSDLDEYGSIYGQSDDDFEEKEPDNVGKIVKESNSIRKKSDLTNWISATQEHSHKMPTIQSSNGDLNKTRTKQTSRSSKNNIRVKSRGLSADKDRARKETMQLDGAGEHVQQVVRNSTSARVEATEMKSNSNGQKVRKDSSTGHQVDEGDGTKSEEGDLSQVKPKQVWPPQKKKIEKVKIRYKKVRGRVRDRGKFCKADSAETPGERDRGKSGRFVSLANSFNSEAVKVNDSSKNVECSVSTSSDDQDGEHTNLTDTKNGDNTESKEKDNQSKETSRKSAVNVPPKNRATTRSMTRSQVNVNIGNTRPGDAHNKDSTTQKRKWICLSEYEAWKKIGLDPKLHSQPPWPCTHPGCDKKAATLGGLFSHHRLVHDTFGDREQNQLAHLLGESYSLFKGREKRAVDRVSSDEDEDDTGDGKGSVKRRRKKKPPKRLSDETIGNNTSFLLPALSAKVKGKKKFEKPLKCQYCHCRYKYRYGLNHHIRSCHRNKWLKRKNPTGANLEELSNISCKKKDESCANISMLADVADAMGEDNLDCKHCSFVARSKQYLKNHLNQVHPKYLKGKYSESESEDEEETQDVDDEGKQSIATLSSRPVRNCRRKQLVKMLAKERKLDKVIPPILPHHGVFSKEIPEEDDDSEQRDENYHAETLLKCQECGFYSVSEYGFVGHMKRMHNQEIVLRYQCDTCELIVSTKQELQTHKRNNHTEQIVCEVCGKSVKGEKRLKVHKKFWCGKEKSRKASVRPRNAIKMSKTCKICNKVCPSYIAYSYHVAGHGIENPFSCPLCQKKFKWKSQLMQHNIKWHTECRYQCDHCSYKSHNKGQLKHHLLRKHDIGGEDFPDLKCPVEECAFTTKLKYKLNRHKEKHDIGRFKHWCHGCNQPVLNLKTWAKHQVLHREGVTKYKCDICGYQSTDSTAAYLHKRSKHTDRRVMCDLCGSSFVNPESLKNHRKILHEKINHFKCRGCEQTFKHHTQMLKHFRTVHVDLARAEEAVQRQEVEEILSGVKKKKKVKSKKPPTGRPLGRPKVPLTPEVIARRKELARIRKQKTNANYMAKLKALGIKRKKYPRKNRGQRTGESNQKPHQTVTTVPFDPNQETASAAQQLENIAQASTSDLQPQEQKDLHCLQARPTYGAFPVKVIPTQSAYGQPTDLHPDTGLQTYAYEQTVTTSSNISESTQYPGFTRQEEVGIVAETVVNDEQSRLEESQEQPVITMAEYPGTVVQEVPASPVELPNAAGPGRQTSNVQPVVSYLEVKTVQSDGSSKVEMWPIWQDS